MQSLAVALLLIEIAGYAYIFHRIIKLPLAVAPGVYVSLVVVLLYASDFLGLLWYARFLVHVVGVVAFFLLLADRSTILSAPHLTSRIKFNVLTMSGLFAALFFLALYANQSLMFWRTDEFSHWGSVIKLVCEANTFHLNPNPLQFKDYPPATALFAYHILGLTGYSEGMAIVSYDIILLAFLLPVLAAAYAANIVLGFVTTALVYVLVTIFGHGWDSVNVDHIVSAAFAGTIIAYLSMGLRLRTLMALPLLLAALSLMKQSGAYLALVAAAVCAVDLAIRQFAAKSRAASEPALRRFDLRYLLWVVLILATPLLANASWKSYLKASHISAGWGSVELSSILPGALKCCETEREIDVTNAYFSKYLGLPKGEPWKGSIIDIARKNWERTTYEPSLPTTKSSTFQVFGFLLAFWAVANLFLGRGVDRWRTFATIAVFAGGMAAFSLSILLSYIYLFNSFEAAQVASFERYHDTYVLAAFLLVLFWIATAIKGRSVVVRFSTTILLALWGYQFMQPARENFIAYRGGQALGPVAIRKSLRPIFEPALQATPPHAKVYVGWLNTTGIQVNMINYELLPRSYNFECFSFVARQPAPQVETCVLSEKELSDRLKEYDYLIVGQGLDRMRQDYPAIFDTQLDESQTLYKIAKDKPLVKAVPVR
jgi:hypothetical protein